MARERDHHRARPRLCLAVAAAAATLGACGGSSPVVHSSPSTASTTTTPPSTTTPSTTAAAGSAPQVRVTPATGLAATQVVQVQASGFPPGDQLVVIECAANGQATGAGNCNLQGLQGTTADAQGDVSTQLTVVKGPFGSAGVVCGGSQGCLVSVTEATPSPTHEADTPISFK
jgi:hypothetical protein